MSATRILESGPNRGALGNLVKVLQFESPYKIFEYHGTQTVEALASDSLKQAEIYFKTH